MIIKSPQLYKYMLRNNILPLPSFDTLRRYSQKFKSIYGFQDDIFEAIKVKVAGLPEVERHGILV
jgi:hypothetical protein